MLSLRGLFFIVLRAMFIIFGLKSIIKQLLDLVFGFSHLKCIIEQWLDSVFVICKIINVSVRVIILAFGSANNSYLGKIIDLNFVFMNSNSIILHVKMEDLR